jgi:hypothetical protein
MNLLSESASELRERLSLNRKPTYDDAAAKAHALGAKRVEQFIDWTWAFDFPTPAAGQEFVAWLEANSFDHRGYSEACPNSDNPKCRVDGVRFRD